MNTNISRRILSLFLALTLTVGLCPVGAAADDAETQETLAAAETTAETTEAETVAPETTVPETQAETTAPATQPSETEEPTVPETTEAAQETEATQAETEPETEPATEPTEETLPAVELPYGFAGLPGDAPLSAQALADKQAMAEHQVAENTATLTPGENYEDGVVLVSAESEEEAQRYADAFSAQLVYFHHGFAKLRLTTATVAQAVEAAQDMTLPLPAVYPNHRTTAEPEPVVDKPSGTGISLFSNDAPQRQSWKTWMENLDNPDVFLKDPSDYSYQYQHDVVDSYAAWGVTTGSGVTVAVLDSGVNPNHEDLAGKVTVIPVQYYDRYGNLQQLPTGPYDNHGTHVAGIIAATMNNDVGGAGVAPDAKILSVRVMDNDGYMYDDYIISGIYLAANRGATVINMSLGGVGYNYWFQEAVNEVTAQGVTVVAAMGNDGTNCMEYPAAYDNVIAVVATDRTNTRAHYSTYGTWADVAAPGTRIFSSSLVGDTGNPGNDAYRPMSGTSMATPVVAGVVALYKSVYPNATPAQIAARLKATATRGGSDLGAGIVNAAKMLSDKPATPAFVVTSGDETVADSTKSSLTVPRESQLEFTFDTYHDKNEYILYTLDGSTPSVKNGAVVKGTVYEGPIDLRDYAGKTITIKAVQINGLGMAGSVLSRRIQVKPAEVVVKDMEITGPSELLAGKAGEFQVKITPTEDWMVADQSVTWRISNCSSNMAKAKIDIRSGRLTTPALSAGDIGYVEITAVSKTYAGKYATFQVTVKALDPVKTMTLSQAKVAIFTGNTHSLDVTMYSVTGAQVTPNVRWTSSNTKVAIVDENGLVTAVGRGGATITCKALDGSGKSAKCTVSVLQKVESITITGQTSVAPGASAAFRATVFPSTATRTLSWSVKGPATITSSGKLTVFKDAPEGATITIKAAPPAGGGVGAEYQVLVKPKANAVQVDLAFCWEGSYPDNMPLDCSYKGDSLSSVTLYSVDPATLFEYEGRQDQVRLAADTFDRNWNCLNNPGCLQFTSSNPAIATVEWSPDGWWLTAHAAGTARITAAAQDGSGKKASFSVKVLNPVSTFSLDTSAPNGNMGWYLLAAGKSVSHKPVFATTYGKPSNQKVTWSYQVEGSNGYSYTYAMRDYIKLDKSGKLTISANAASYIQNLAQSNILLYVDVTASSQDYVWAEDTFRYQLVVPTTTMRATYSKITCVDGPGYFYGAEFYCNQWSETDSKSDFYGMSDFAVTSSNPSVISVDGVYRTSYKNWHNVVFYAAKRGSANLTIRTTDGTNKSCSINVTVK